MEERAYTIPLRTVYNRAKRAVRAKRAMKHIREFIARHMKVPEENVKIHVSVNHAVWQRGIQKPPRKVKVVAIKDGETVWVYTPEERAKLVEAAKKKRARAKKSVEKKAGQKQEAAEEKPAEEKKAKRATRKKSTSKKSTKKEEQKNTEEESKTKIEPAAGQSEEQ